MTTALIGRRPCGCVERVEFPSDGPGRFTPEADLISDGLTVEHMEEDEAEYVPVPDCPHGSVQQQLAALVKKQAKEIAYLWQEIINVQKEQP